MNAAESVAKTGPAIDAIPAEVHVAVKNSDPARPEKTPVPVVKKASKPVETAPETPVSPKTPVPPTTPEQPKSSGTGFLPLVLGGLIAGVIGFAMATLTTPTNDNALADQLAAQATTIAALEQRIAGIPEVNLSGIEAAQAAIGSDITGLKSSVVDITDRLATLEERPAIVVDGSNPAVAGVEAEMDALRAQIAEMTGAARTELEEARAAAAAIEENAAAAARNAAARAALARVQTSLESGAPIGAALGDLENATKGKAPDALIAVQDGVPTLASLQEQFPEVARMALATARSEGVAGEETSGLGAFIRNQLDVRSTVPREGDDADAILSRAEASVRSGRLSDALAEISALPEVARAEMADWLGQAEARAAAMAAVDILSSSLSDN